MAKEPDSDIDLDESAENLYAKLLGIEESSGADQGLTVGSGFIESLAEEEKALDERRALLIELLHNISTFLNSARMGEDAKSRERLLGLITGLLTRVKSGDSSGFLIRHRGTARNLDDNGEEVSDYIVTSGSFFVDMAVANEVARRQGKSQSHLPGRLSIACKTFEALRFNSLYIEAEAKPKDVRDSLLALADYIRQTATAESAKQAAGNLIYDENHLPDPNLTILAALSGYDRGALQGIVKKVAGLMDQAGTHALERYPNVYEALFDIKQVKDSLRRPAVEVNNVRWLMIRRGQSVMSKEDATIARTALASYRDTPESVSSIMSSIQGSSYNSATADTLQRTLSAANGFLAKVNTGDNKRITLSRIRSGLNQVSDETLDSITVRDGRLLTQLDQGNIVFGTMEPEMVKAIQFYKHRSIAKRKIREMMFKPVNLTPTDLKVMAIDFGVSVEDVTLIFRRLKSCFGANGRFLRRAFDENMDLFAKYELKIFEFLWRFMDDMVQRDDRVAFLNAVQLLIERLSDRRGVLRFLLEEFSAERKEIRFSDRNSLLMATLLLRKYNKELHHNIEMTPEEVILVRDGIDGNLVKWIAAYMDSDPDRFYKKAKALHMELFEQLGGVRTAGAPFRFLVATVREYYIFMALNGSEVSRKIISMAVREFGEPSAPTWSLVDEKTDMRGMMQLFQVSVRGLCRFNNLNDEPTLRRIKNRESEFTKRHGHLLAEGTIGKLVSHINDGLTKIAKAHSQIVSS